MKGRPRKFTDITVLEDTIDQYFIDREKDDKQPTISGLAYHLGFESRQSIYDYIDRKDDFSYVIKRATLFLEDMIEQKLFSNNATGAIFWLKNRGWRDKHEVEQTIKDVTVLTDVLEQLDETD